MRKFKELTKQEILEAIEEQETLASILSSLECHDNTSNRNKLKQFIIDNNINTSHIKIPLTRAKYEENSKRCKYCGKIIPFEKRENDFCDRSCSASYNNPLKEDRSIESRQKTSDTICDKLGIEKRPVKDLTEGVCLNCGKPISNRNKFCNNTCYAEYQRREYIKRWKEGKETGIKGADDIATAVRVYIREKYNNSCQLCGWNQVNRFTGLVPLQIHHIDGDCMNNSEENLQLLCPNCHSLTENFGARNQNCTRIDKRIR